MLRIPVATYRVQFNAGFTFDDARRIADYLQELGITDLYASPILKARKGSLHGYDVVDAAALNPELGTEDDFGRLHERLKQLDIGFLLDVVPNHMAASRENAWWMSVLENGKQSRFLHYFDIDWRPVTSRGQTEEKVLLPILGKPYGEAIESGEVQLGFDADGFFLTYYDNRLPLAPKSYTMVLGECVESLPTEGVAIELRDLVAGDEKVTNSKFLKETLWRIYEQSAEFRQALDATIVHFNGKAGSSDTFNALDSLLDAQFYRLAYWRIASEKINYRRFFDVTDLVGVRIENPEVFEARNRRTLDLIAEGKVTGLRIDHIDGLFDPIGHMKKLQLRLGDANPESRAPNPAAFYIVVEKILARDETLPKTFEVCGTTGYDFANAVNALFVDPEGLTKLGDFYREFTGVTKSFDDICYERRKQVISELFPGEMRALGKQLGELSMHDRNARDFAPSDLLAALVEITACMHVYRTYIRDFEVTVEDRRFIRQAVAEARRRAGISMDQRLFEFLECMLLVDPPSYVASEREHWLAFVMRWQQFTGRVMAKGVEDTAFYNYNRLISLNEVGSDPGREAGFDPVAEFHQRNERIQKDWRHTLNATSTHDTKRSEDVRARINVLSELADSWQRDVRRWSDMNSALRHHGVPAPNEELLIYQTLLGMWPVDEEELEAVEERLRQFLEKAAREAKTCTNWIAPSPEYEKALLDFGSAALGNLEFRASMMRTQRRVAYHGFLNALAQLVLKITSPGVPDFYQGTDVWDLSLVDPDNRRPVDYEKRRSMLKKMKASYERGTLDLATMQRRFFDGRIKLFTTWRTLDLRRRRAESFQRGGYRAITAQSPNVCAFLRGDDVIVAVPRLTTRLCKPDVPPLGAAWGEASLPVEITGTFEDIFTRRAFDLTGEPVPLAEIFSLFPVAVLERRT
ncbi:MAG TPA: malto-oligosyltrehalose synthase [Thermoanaerobaculia bacterium]|nr:malto-oligosyltrehalose synthase [Thermoanaerobaculia bacterium]